MMKEILDDLYFCSGFILAEIKFNGNINLQGVLDKIDNIIEKLHEVNSEK